MDLKDDEDYQDLQSESETSSDDLFSETSSSDKSNHSRYHFSQDSEQREIEEQQDFDFMMNKDMLMQEDIKYSDEFSNYSSNVSDNEYYDEFDEFNQNQATDGRFDTDEKKKRSLGRRRRESNSGLLNIN